jgi:hypothetical protein
LGPQADLQYVVDMTDIAPTLANLLHIQAPDGNIGDPIRELIRCGHSSSDMIGMKK